MSPASWSLVAFVVAVVLSCTSRINVGLIALALAWGLGVGFAGLKPEAVASGFPSGLFLTLLGVTLLFGLAEGNGTLEAVARRVLGAVRAPRAVPALIFLVGAILSAIGPGAVPATAMMAPLAMAIGRGAGVSAFLVALMLANGANAGNLSPLSAVGVIARDGMAKAGIVNHEGKVFLANLAAHVFVAAIAWLWLRPRGGARDDVSVRRRDRAPCRGTLRLPTATHHRGCRGLDPGHTHRIPPDWFLGLRRGVSTDPHPRRG